MVRRATGTASEIQTHACSHNQHCTWPLGPAIVCICDCVTIVITILYRKLTRWLGLYGGDRVLPQAYSGHVWALCYARGYVVIWSAWVGITRLLWFYDVVCCGGMFSWYCCFYSADCHSVGFLCSFPILVMIILLLWEDRNWPFGTLRLVPCCLRGSCYFSGESFSSFIT